MNMTIRKAPFFAYFPKTYPSCGRVFIFKPYWKVPVAPAFLQGSHDDKKIVCKDCYDKEIR